MYDDQDTSNVRVSPTLKGTVVSRGTAVCGRGTARCAATGATISPSASTPSAQPALPPRPREPPFRAPRQTPACSYLTVGAPARHKRKLPFSCVSRRRHTRAPLRRRPHRAGRRPGSGSPAPASATAAARIAPLSRKARRNRPSVSAGRIFGAMPPPMNTPPVRHRAQRQVAGFGAVGVDEQLERVDAAGAAPLERRRGDLRRRVRVARSSSTATHGAVCVTR